MQGRQVTRQRRDSRVPLLATRPRTGSPRMSSPARTPPIPRTKRETPRSDPPSGAQHGRGKPRQLPAHAAPGLGRKGPNASQAQPLDPFPNRLADVMSEHRTVFPKRIGSGQAGRPNPFRGMHVADSLAARQRAFHENRSVVFPKFLRFVRPALNESLEIQARRDLVFVQVERREAVRRIPATAPPLREARIQRIGPCRVGDAPPGVIVGDSLDDQVRRQLCTRPKSNMSRHADKRLPVSPSPSRSSRETPSRAGIGRRTTAGILSRLR